jgi:hypothetical protein
VTRQQRRGGVLAAIACLAALITACSSGQAARGVASLPGATAAAAAGQAAAQQDQKLVSFARCMRGHGVNVPDPQQGKPYGIPVGSDPVTAAAMRACGHLLPTVETGTGAGQAGRVAAAMPGLIGYARCMRAHDIAMLDPAASGALNLGTVPGITNDFGRYSPQFRAADQACRHLLPAGVHDEGTGP